MPHVTHDGAKIYWEETGAGEPLLLIHGLGATLEWWERLMPLLTSSPGPRGRFRTIRMDNRGVGRSDVPSEPYSIAGMAADAAAVLDAVGVDTAHVCGMSMGGMIAQEVALQFPNRVRSLILGCTACGGHDAAPARREVLEALGARARLPREEAMRLMVPYTFDASTPRERIDEDFAVRLRATVTNEGFFAQLAAIRAWSGTLSRLGRIKAPTLVIHGESDELVPPQNAAILARAIPNAQLVMLPHASHTFFTDQLEAASEAVL